MSVRPELTRPLCNRVTPFGEIVRHPARGTLLGNRGCLHDVQGNIVRGPTTNAWISCKLPDGGMTRNLMQFGRYTELFFLDEPTALAAGHRPCGYCQPERLNKFKQAWRAAYRLSYLPRVAEIDRVLRSEEVYSKSSCRVHSLPPGAMVKRDVSNDAWLLSDGQFLRWSLAGYSIGGPVGSEQVIPITTASIIMALRNGYDAVPPTELLT